jgi:succinyl-diaminopimelate desuccinylase
MAAAHSPAVALAMELMRRPSCTPDDAGCQDLLADRLRPLGFHVEEMPFGNVRNLWARHGTAAPLFAFAGHTDVVPTGPLVAWTTPPFEPEIRGGLLYGRGAADMKGSLAAMIVAVTDFVQTHPHHKGSIALLITSDEEGVAVDGTRRVVDIMAQRNEHIDYCLVGEPSSVEVLGDTVKNGRRGTITGRLVVNGRQGHVAYPQLADNPLHRLAPALAELCAVEWDRGNADFPPTSFQVSNLHAGTGADNVIPGSAEMIFNLRYSTEITADEIRRRVHAILDRHRLDYQLEWRHSGTPFLTRKGDLAKALQTAIREVTGIETQFSTAGGTSDGRFIAPMGAQVVELGPVNASIHQVNEHVRVEDIDRLAVIYRVLLEKLLI